MQKEEKKLIKKNNKSTKNVEITKNNETLQKEKKKSIMIIVGLIILLIALILGFIVSSHNEYEKQNDVSGLEEFYEHFNSEDLQIIFFVRTGCSWCSKQAPILETIANDYNLDYYTYDAAEYTNTQVKKVIDELNIKGATPTIVIVKAGEILDTNVGYLDGDALVEFLIGADVLDENAEYSGNSESSNEDSEYKNLTFIDMTEYKELIDKKEAFIVTIGQTSCSHCIATKPVIDEIAGDYSIPFYYLNLTDMDEDERADFFDSLTELQYTEESFVNKGSIGTPLTLVIKNNKIQSYISGEAAYSKYVKLLKKYNIITEE